MKLFTVGPVMMYPETLRIEGSQQPYFRTPEFSKVMKDIEGWFLQSVHAPRGSEFIALTSSGTGAMDATVSNLLTKNDKVLVINGGSFGARFSHICDHYSIPHEDYVIPFLHAFEKEEFGCLISPFAIAIATTMALYSTTIIYALYVHKFISYDVKYVGKCLGISIVQCGLMYLLIAVIGKLPVPRIPMLIIDILVGVTIYLLTSMLFKNDAFLMLKNFIHAAKGNSK